jgi:hypothetical protein
VAEGDSTADSRLHWFTPAVEVNLCGHTQRADGALSLDFPAWPPRQIDSGWRQRSLQQLNG